MKNKEPLIIRADAGEKIGTGHVMRCLALAQTWLDAGGEVYCLLEQESPFLNRRLKEEGIHLIHLQVEAGSDHDARETARLVKELNGRWIVLDGYQFGSRYQKIIHDSGASLLVIDDYGHANHYYADIVLNQNLYADMSYYPSHEPDTRFLLGLDYALIRREFLNLPAHTRKISGTANRILVTFGGSDPGNITQAIIENLKKIRHPGLEVIAVVGGANRHYNTLARNLKDTRVFSIRQDVTNMPDLMLWADLAITAGGSTCWELAYTGLPCVIIPVSPDQDLIASELAKRGVAVTLGRPEEIADQNLIRTLTELINSPDKRTVLSGNGKRIVDGNGVLRIMSALSK